MPIFQTHTQRLIGLIMLVCMLFSGFIYPGPFLAQSDKEASVYVKYDNGAGWKESINSFEGDVINVLIALVNTGDESLSDVNIQDSVPTNTSYVRQSSQKWEYGESTWQNLSDTGETSPFLHTDGYDTSFTGTKNLDPGMWGYYTYQVKVWQTIGTGATMHTHTGITVSAGNISWLWGQSEIPVNYADYETPPNFLYSQNAGYISVRPTSGTQTTVTDSDVSGWMYSESIGWISLAWTTPSGSGYEVTNTKNGVLSGHAWNENAGFIRMRAQSGSSLNYGVTINGNGFFEGYAYSEGLGFLKFSDDPTNLAGHHIAQTSWRPKGLVSNSRYMQDIDGNGYLDTLKLTLNKNLNDSFSGMQIDITSSQTGSIFQDARTISVTGANIQSQKDSSTENYDNVIYASFSGLAINTGSYNTHLTPDVYFIQNSSLTATWETTKSFSGNSWSGSDLNLLSTKSGSNQISFPSYDRAGPILNEVIYNDNLTETKDDDFIDLRFSEPIYSSILDTAHPQGTFTFTSSGTDGTYDSWAHLDLNATSNSSNIRIYLGSWASNIILGTDTGTLLTWAVTDMALNPNQKQSKHKFLDRIAPRVVSGHILDTDNNGYIDRFEISFNESITGITAWDPAQDTWSIVASEYTTTDSAFSGSQSIWFDVSEKNSWDWDTHQIPTIIMSGANIQDASIQGNNIPNQSITESKIINKAAPVLMRSAYHPSQSGTHLDQIKLEFSETVSGSLASSTNLSGSLAQDIVSLSGDGVFSENSKITNYSGNTVWITMGSGSTRVQDSTDQIRLLWDTVQDLQDNVSKTGSYLDFADINPPEVSEIRTIDQNNDGHIDAYDIVFNEQISYNTGSVSISGANVLGTGTVQSGDTLRISVERTDSGKKYFDTSITGSTVQAATGLVLDTASVPNANNTFLHATQTDKAAPMIIGTHAYDTGSIVVRFSESISGSTADIIQSLSGSMGGQNISFVSGSYLDSPDNQILKLETFAHFANGDMGTLSLTGSIQDNFGNTNTHQVGSGFIIGHKIEDYAFADNGGGYFSYNCSQNQSCTSIDTIGVYHAGRIDAPHMLAGYAYSDGGGYMHFGDYYRKNSQSNWSTPGVEVMMPQTITQSGSFTLSGYAFGENLGLIHFASGSLYQSQEKFISKTHGGKLRDYAYGDSMGYIELGPRLVYIHDIFTKDSDINGKIDTLVLQTNKSLNDDFQSITTDLSKFTTSTGLQTGTWNYDTLLEIPISETQEYNTDTTGTLEIQNNNHLGATGYNLVAHDEMLLANQKSFIEDKVGPYLISGGINTQNTKNSWDDIITLALSESIGPKKSGNDATHYFTLSGGSFGSQSTLQDIPENNNGELRIRIWSWVSNVSEDDYIGMRMSTLYDTSANENPNSHTGLVLLQDKTPPLVQTGTTFDANSNGFIDRIRLHFNDIMQTGSIIDSQYWSISGHSIQSGNWLSSNTYEFTINETGNTTAATPTISYNGSGSVLDKNNNNLEALHDKTTIDRAYPVLKTGTGYDNNNDGKTEKIVLTFNEAMNTGSFAVDEWTLVEYGLNNTLTPTSFVTISGSTVSFDMVLWAQSTNEIQLSYSGTTTKDIIGNKLQSISGQIINDKAAPKLQWASYDYGDSTNVNDDILTLSFTEIIRTPSSSSSGSVQDYFTINGNGDMSGATIISSDTGHVVQIQMSASSTPPALQSDTIVPTQNTQGVQNFEENNATGSSIIHWSVNISEILYQSETQHSGWIELQNNSHSNRSLSGYIIGNTGATNGTTKSGKASYMFPDNAQIQGKGNITVAYSGTTFASQYGYAPDFEIQDSSGSIPNLTQQTSGWDMQLWDNETLYLWDASTQITDTMSYGNESDAYSHTWVNQTGASLKSNTPAQHTIHSGNDYQKINADTPPKPDIRDVFAPILQTQKTLPKENALYPELKPRLGLVFHDNNGGLGFNPNTALIKLEHTHSGVTQDWSSFATGSNQVLSNFPQEPYNLTPEYTLPIHYDSDLSPGKHTITYEIEDKAGNSTSGSTNFYIDDFDYTIEPHNAELGSLEPNKEHYSFESIKIQVQTYGAGYNIQLKGDDTLISGNESIPAYITGSPNAYGYGYGFSETSNYSGATIKTVPKNSTSLHTEPSQTPSDTLQTKTYYLFFRTKIDSAQAAGEYNAQNQIKLTDVFYP